MISNQTVAYISLFYRPITYFIIHALNYLKKNTQEKNMAGRLEPLLRVKFSYCNTGVTIC